MAGRGEETGARRSLKPKPLGKISMRQEPGKEGQGRVHRDKLQKQGKVSQAAFPALRRHCQDQLGEERVCLVYMFRTQSMTDGSNQNSRWEL